MVSGGETTMIHSELSCVLWGYSSCILRHRFTVSREALFESRNQRDTVETFDLDFQGCLESLEGVSNPKDRGGLEGLQLCQGKAEKQERSTGFHFGVRGMGYYLQV